MTAKIINGKEVANKILEKIAHKITQSETKPTLAVIIVGNDPASEVYVRNKIAACHKVGMLSEKFNLPEDTSESDLLEKIEAINTNPSIDGILLQLPLPSHINSTKVLEAIAPEKDVDGFHEKHMGRLVADLPSLRPCTPSGCMVLLKETGIDLAGVNAVIIGRSHIVGKPMALMLINAGATVTVCNSKTRNLAEIVKTADVVVAAVGRANFITGEMIKPGAVVIDVGINRTEDKKIVGDVDFESVSQKAAFITPVPGGVGPMTIAMLVSNTLEAVGL